MTKLKLAPFSTHEWSIYVELYSSERRCYFELDRVLK